MEVAEGPLVTKEMALRRALRAVEHQSPGLNRKQFLYDGILAQHLINPSFLGRRIDMVLIFSPNHIIPKQNACLVEQQQGLGNSVSLERETITVRIKKGHDQDTWVYLCFAKVVDHQHAGEVQQHTQGLEGDDSESQVFILLDKARAVISTEGAAFSAGQADICFFCPIFCAS